MSTFLTRPSENFTGKEPLKLFRGEELIGTITNTELDWPLHEGKIELSPAVDVYRPLWEFWTIEGNRAFDPPFEIPDDIDENWFIESPAG